MSELSSDEQFMRQCEAAKKESHDPGRQVGAVLVSPAGHPLATGTNRPPLATGLTVRDSHNAIEHDPNWKYYILEHAERNAISNAREMGSQTDGSTMYVSLFPCADCARAMVAAGVKRVVVPEISLDAVEDDKWRLHFKYAKEIFRLAGTKVDFVTN